MLMSKQSPGGVTCGIKIDNCLFRQNSYTIIYGRDAIYRVSTGFIGLIYFLDIAIRQQQQSKQYPD